MSELLPPSDLPVAPDAEALTIADLFNGKVFRVLRELARKADAAVMRVKSSGMTVNRFGQEVDITPVALKMKPVRLKQNGGAGTPGNRFTYDLFESWQDPLTDTPMSTAKTPQWAEETVDVQAADIAVAAYLSPADPSSPTTNEGWVPWLGTELPLDVDCTV
jgi:hypothetical protein